MTLLVFYVSLALGVSFLCSVMEAVLLSVSPSYVGRLEKERGAVGRALRNIKDNIDRPLAAILSLNTIAHTVGAAGAGAQAAKVFGNSYVGVISAVLTFLILVVSEIIPKTLGAVYWRRLAPWITRILVPTIWLMWPLVKMAEGLTWLMARDKKKMVISREDLKALAELGAEAGVVGQDEERILKNLLRLHKIKAHDVMTPRTVVFALPAQNTVDDVLAEHPEMRFSRIPIYAADLDDVTGFVLKSDILLLGAQNRGETPLAELQRPIPIVPEDLPLSKLFERLMDEQNHVALVVDEYGGTEGLVTIEDLLETLLGLEIVDEADAVDDMQELARRRWSRRARQLGVDPAELPEK